MDELQYPLKIKLGEVIIQIKADREFIRDSFFYDKYLPFLCDGDPDFTLDFQFVDHEVPVAWQECFDSEISWRFYRTTDCWGFYFYGSENEPYQWSYISEKNRRGTIFHRTTYFSNRKIQYPFDNRFAQLLITHLLALGEGLLVHACAVKDGDSGYLFMGNSGHGKSTLARLWQNDPEVTVLSDDRIILEKRSDGYWISGTPWPGDARAVSALSVPLTRIYFLHHANQNWAKPLTPLEFSRGVLTRSFPTYWYAPGMDSTLKFLDEFCQKQNGFELGFVPDQSVLDFVRAGV
jgi:hypothetical protein